MTPMWLLVCSFVFVSVFKPYAYATPQRMVQQPLVRREEIGLSELPTSARPLARRKEHDMVEDEGILADTEGGIPTDATGSQEMKTDVGKATVRNTSNWAHQKVETPMSTGGSGKTTVCEKVEPELQLREKYNIGFYSVYENADTKLLREGVKAHPMLSEVLDNQNADFVLWSLQGSGEASEGAPPPGVPSEKIVQIDWSDGPMTLPYINKSQYLAIFKRSYVSKTDGVLVGVAGGCDPEDCFPFGYAIMDGYFDDIDCSTIGQITKRPTSVMCSLRPLLPPETETIQRQVGIARNRVLWWLHHDPDLPANVVVTGLGNLSSSPSAEGFNSVLQTRASQKTLGSAIELEEGGDVQHAVERQRRQPQSLVAIDVELEASSAMGPAYKSVLRDALVAVTADPASYEGDHRLWEHFSSGNAVLSGKIYTPLPFPPVPGEHFETFDIADSPGNQEAFYTKLHKMLRGGSELEAMACRGFQHGLRHHTSVSRLDYVVRSLAELTKGASYTETGMQLRKRDPKPTAEEQAYKPPSAPEYLLHINNLPLEMSSLQSKSHARARARA